MPKKKKGWQYGQKAQLALRAGMTRSHLNDVLNGRIYATPEVATRIADAAKTLGLDIKRANLIFPEQYPHHLLDKMKGRK